MSSGPSQCSTECKSQRAKRRGEGVVVVMNQECSTSGAGALTVFGRMEQQK